ncbi:MAG: RNA 2',3'-cyclic phosphodiesterase [Chloroflexota bacterium]|nr:RNA 2',3'-cyclic phosphodiesterase [Chloroflexota bacterium]MDE2896351.1 RNA 2',3'-cyclic phosphodiesterase [Chloroflexota bacterium]
MRMFVEASLEQSVLDEVWSVGRRLAADSEFPERSLRWVKREALHLTLRFIGEVELELLPDVTAALDELADSGRFELTLSALGTFGGRRPRVVKVGFAEDGGFERLLRLRRQLDGALSEVGFETERGPYRPHLTLGRVRRQATREDLAAIREAVDAAPALQITSSVDRLALVESTLLTSGPRYRRVAVVEL